ncbi:MAG TPA: DUF4203 domain-containing protein [Thermotogota bacterium]|nr:DUF4203 domain-containing protein [Thermotogota bacterium]
MGDFLGEIDTVVSNCVSFLQGGQNAYLWAVMIFNMVFGLIQCYSGYRIFKFLLVLTGSFVGGMIGVGLCFLVPSSLSALRLLLPIIFAILGGLLYYRVYYFGLFSFGFVIGFFISFLLSLGMPISIVLAVISGILFIKLNKILICFSSSYGGAFSFIFGEYYIIKALLSESSLNMIGSIQILTTVLVINVVGGIVMGTVGFFYQMGWYRKKCEDAQVTTPTLE